MWFDFAILAGGLLLLYFGAEWFVAGAAGLARSLGVSALLVGLTVVAYGTSMPEVVVSVQGALAGHGDIALGNVIGSNIANIGLILGITALVKPTRVDGALRRREVPVLIASAFALPVLLQNGSVSRLEGGLLLLSAVLYTLWMVRGARHKTVEAAAAAQATMEAVDLAGAPSAHGSRLRLGIVAVVGLGVLMVGGQLFVEGAVRAARSLGMSERLVGLTIVSIGTSLPELATSLIAAFRGHSDIAVGNVVGSNIFNVLLCLGAAGLAGSVSVSFRNIAVDVTVMVGLTLLVAVMMRTEREISRAEGGILLASYSAFLASLVFMR